MATFLESLYHAHSFTSREKCRYDLEYVGCTPDALYATDGKKLYTGHPRDYPWRQLARVATSDSMIFLVPRQGRVQKSRIDCGYTIDKDALHALGVTWELRADGVSFPPVKNLVGQFKTRSFYPVRPDEWKRLVKARTRLAEPDGGRKYLVYIRQGHGRVTVSGKHAPLEFTISDRASKDEAEIVFDFALWPHLSFPPKEVAVGDGRLMLRRGREKMVLLGIKTEA